jgi:3-hydroxyisobutyrate dehydrogenase-like beta-hydroxyacid dehydrogenase
MTTLGLIGAGAMGAATGARLVQGGFEVLTPLDGRSAETRRRAEAAGLVPASLGDLARADLILTIVPPGEAIGVATALAPILAASSAKPAYIDFNAVNPATTLKAVAEALAQTGCDVIDGSIIGGPPGPTGPGPAYYVSGDPNGRAQILAPALRVKGMEGPLGAASSLKMVYAGISKGLIGLGAAMYLAAARDGAASTLRSQMEEDGGAVLGRLTGGVPGMYAKAYRWIDEMHEIADYLGADNPAATIFRGMADLYVQMAADHDGERALSAMIDEALGV